MGLELTNTLKNPENFCLIYFFCGTLHGVLLHNFVNIFYQVISPSMGSLEAFAYLMGLIISDTGSVVLRPISEWCGSLKNHIRF